MLYRFNTQSAAGRAATRPLKSESESGTGPGPQHRPQKVSSCQPAGVICLSASRFWIVSATPHVSRASFGRHYMASSLPVCCSTAPKTPLSTFPLFKAPHFATPFLINEQQRPIGNLVTGR